MENASLSPSITFRDATTAEDFALIQALAKRIWPYTYGTILTPEQIEYMLEWMYAPKALQSDFENGIRFFLVYADGCAVGYVGYGPAENREAMIHKVYLLPDQHHRGIGQAMLREALSRIRAEGYSSAILHVNRFNERAIKAYHRAGFSTRRSVVTDIGHGFVMDDLELEILFQ